MGKVQAVLTREFLHVPVYAWAAGAVALVGAYFYFRSHLNTGDATAAPQVLDDSNANDIPYPFPDPGSGAAGIPPSPAFDVSGSALALYPPSTTFPQPPIQSTSSQAIGSAVNASNPNSYPAGSIVAAKGAGAPGYANPPTVKPKPSGGVGGIIGAVGAAVRNGIGGKPKPPPSSGSIVAAKGSGAPGFRV